MSRYNPDRTTKAKQYLCMLILETFNYKLQTYILIDKDL